MKGTVRSAIKARIKAPAGSLPGFCAIPDCSRPTMRASGVGLGEMHCRYHVQLRARHGSHWCPTYKAADLRPYIIVANDWIKRYRREIANKYALVGLRGLLDRAGHVERAQDIKHRSAAFKARVAFARLREAGITPERMLAIHMAVSALIEDDAGSHRVREFRIVQVAKALHRLASGTHRLWDFPMDDGTTLLISTEN